VKIVLWIGNEENQRALACKLADNFKIVGIVTETRSEKKSKVTLRKVVNKLFSMTFLRKVDRAWFGMKDEYARSFPYYPSVDRIDVENINLEQVKKFTNSKSPDLVLVSGTRLVKQELLNIESRIGILNLHTGLSPYIKGGPNCTNWCISTSQFHLIGNTIMWIDAGIDSGDLICTEFTLFDGTENLLDIHFKVMEHAHEIYIKAVQFLESGEMKRVPQVNIGSGRTYYSKDWGGIQKYKLIKNLPKFRASITRGDISERRENIEVVSLG
jgi:methionyl-tRNA formyltransferase